MRKILVPILASLLVFSQAGFYSPASAQAAADEFSKNYTPPNELGIVKLLKQKGVINEKSTQEVIEKAVQDYIQQKLVKGQQKASDKQTLLKELKRNNKDIKIGNLVKGKGQREESTELEGVQEKTWTGDVREAKMLILLAEFGDDEYGIGPLHNKITPPAPDNDYDFWVNDFSKEHYKKMLFTKGGYTSKDQNGQDLHLDSMVDYYLEQSGGSYSVTGDVYGWYKLPHSEAYYGDDEAGGTDNKLPGTPSTLVSDLLDVAVKSKQINFAEYDKEDSMDLDGDGNLDEPDGIIDHLVIVHAGVDQSGGGGAQGDSAIWAHSSSVFDVVPAKIDKSIRWEDDEGDRGILAYNYIIQGENGTIGVFTHEFGHDLGLPDEYDTIYSGNGEPVGFYSLMASGSWTGKPLGTKPAPISPWGRWVLGSFWGGQWVEPTVVNYEDITTNELTYKLDQTTSVGQNNQVIKVNLPNKFKIMTSPFEGTYEFYGGKGDEIDHTLMTTTPIDLTGASNATLDFYTWYNIEKDWDFGFVQVSIDGGTNWTSLPSARTTDTIVADGYPTIKPNMPGYTGSSGGWVNEIIDLSSFKGQKILLRFRYMTDWGTTLEGFFVDNVSVYVDGSEILTDGAEAGDNNWISDGWQVTNGSEEKAHYYMLEWRSYNKTDEALKYGYNWNGDVAEFYKHDRGMLVWYRDTAYDDNWVGVHPGHGFLGIVDAHPEPIVAKGYTIRTRIQLHDAAFGIDRSEDKQFTFFGKEQILQGKQAVPEFDDSQVYWYNKAPSSGLKLPNYGLKFKVLGRSADYSVGEISIYK